MSPEITDSLARVLCHSHFKEAQRPLWPKLVRVLLEFIAENTFVFVWFGFRVLKVDTKFDVLICRLFVERTYYLFYHYSALLLFKRVLGFDSVAI